MAKKEEFVGADTDDHERSAQKELAGIEENRVDIIEEESLGKGLWKSELKVRGKSKEVYQIKFRCLTRYNVLLIAVYYKFYVNF